MIFDYLRRLGLFKIRAIGLRQKTRTGDPPETSVLLIREDVCRVVTLFDRKPFPRKTVNILDREALIIASSRAQHETLVCTSLFTCSKTQKEYYYIIRIQDVPRRFTQCDLTRYV